MPPRSRTSSCAASASSCGRVPGTTCATASAQVTCPTLVACGRYDGIAPLPNSEAIVERVPDAELRDLRRRPRLLRPGPEGAARDHRVPRRRVIDRDASLREHRGHGGTACTRRSRSDPLAGRRSTTARRRTPSRRRSTRRSRGTTARAQRPALDKLYEKAKIVAVERLDRPRLVDRRRSRAHRGRARRSNDRRMQYVRALDRRAGLAGRAVGRAGDRRSTRWRTSRTA